MGHFVWSDVVLAPVSLEKRGVVKIRPAVVVAVGKGGDLFVCPVSRKPPSDAPCTPLNIDDFESGGLDLFGESFILTSRVRTIRSGEVIGKRGRLNTDSIEAIVAQVPAPLLTDGTSQKESPRSRSRR